MSRRLARALLVAAGLFTPIGGDAPRGPSTVAPLSAAGPSIALEVGWISREPRFRAPATLDGPQTDGWPAAGSAVQWIGHLLNRSTTTVSGVPYVRRRP